MKKTDRLWALVRHLDAPIAEGDWPARHRGRQLAETPDEVAHEIAHFLVAPPSRRRRPHFGLGPASAEGPHVNALVGRETRNDEERLASLLGIIILVTAGLRKEAMETLVEHNWTVGHSWLVFGADSSPALTCSDLIERGLVTGPRFTPERLSVPWRYVGPGAALLTGGR